MGTQEIFDQILKIKQRQSLFFVPPNENIRGDIYV